MKILYDLSATQPVGGIKFHGGSEYSKILFRDLINKRDNRVNIDVYYDKTRNIDKALIGICKENNINIHDIEVNNELNELINKGEYDVVYSALPGNEYSKVNFPLNTKLVITQHGLRGLELISDKYQWFYLNGLKNKIKYIGKRFFPQRTIKKRKKYISKIFSITKNIEIITDSQHSKNSILYHFPNLKENQIIVAAAMAKKDDNIEKQEEEMILNKLNIKSKKYILLVSADRWEKNNYRMIKAIVKVLKTRKQLFEKYKILVLGNEGGNIYKDLIEDEYKDFFIFKGYVEEHQLNVLYKNAFTLFYPSLNEGFGYPPLEAMKYETFSVCAADSSITEVCGDAVIYFNPYDIDEMAIRVIQSFDTVNRNVIKSKMVKQYEYIHNLQELGSTCVINKIYGE